VRLGLLVGVLEGTDDGDPVGGGDGGDDGDPVGEGDGGGGGAAHSPLLAQMSPEQQGLGDPAFPQNFDFEPAVTQDCRFL